MTYRRWAEATRSFVPFPHEAIESSIPAYFERIARLHADRIAIQTGEAALSYSEVNRQANRVARTLIARLGKENEPVALLLEHGAAPIVAMFGAFKAAKICIALDTTHPSAHLGPIVQDSEARLIITNGQNLALAQEVARVSAAGLRPAEILNLDEPDGSFSGDDKQLVVSPDAIAQIHYTSGSTGKPKGAMQSHRFILHKTMNSIADYRMCPDDRMPLFFSISFSWATSIVFRALLTGATILPHSLQAIGMGALAKWLVENRITVLSLAPSALRQLAESLPAPDEHRFPHLRLLNLSGQGLTQEEITLWRQHFAPDSLLGYSLASTEAGTITRLFLDKDWPVPEGIVPVGYPIDDTEIMLLDENGATVPPGQVGEIAVKSRYLISGYWHNPDLTRAVFFRDPDGTDKRIYFTRDLGRLRPDGALEWAGRKDFQVKIRRHTVQPATVEAALLDLAKFKEVVVVPRPDGRGELQLIAYLVSKTQAPPNASEVRGELVSKIPEYMIPSSFVYIEALPRTPHGKIDSSRLPDPGRARPVLDTPLVTPRTQMEARIAEVWREVLGLDEVGVDDNFFELGGDSLWALRMILEVEKIAGQQVPMEYFRRPTIAMLARFCESGELPAETPPSVASIPSLASTRNRRRLERLVTGQVAPNAVLRQAVQSVLLRLSYSEGLRWLGWIGRPSVANRLYRDERATFTQLAAELGNPSAAADDAFCASVLGNVIWQCFQGWRLTAQVSSGEAIEVMHTAPYRFWRSLAYQVDHAVNAQRGRLIEFKGLEHLYRAHKSKCGTIMVTYHNPATSIANAILLRYTNLGHIRTISQWTAEQLAEREFSGSDQIDPRRVSVWSSRLTVQAAHSLRQGSIVQIVNDVTASGGKFVDKAIGRRQYRLAPGFAELALATGAIVLPVVSMFDSAGRVHMTVLPALQPGNFDGNHDAAVDDLVNQYVAFVEEQWHRSPESVGWGAQRRYLSRPLTASL